MKVLFFKTNLFFVVLFCAASVFAQSAEEWVSGYKTDNIEVFYRFEKSGSNSYEAEVKIVNSRAKPVDVIVKFEQKEVSANPSVKSTRRSIKDLIRNDDGTYIKLTVKSKGTVVSEKIEIDGSEIKGVKIACWSNVDSQNKCALESFLQQKSTTNQSQNQSIAVTSRPNCVISYGNVCWTIQPPTTPRCSGFPYVSPKVTISSDGLSCTLVVPANSAQGVRAIDSSGRKFILEKGDEFEINASGQVKFSNDHPCVTPEGMRGWYDPNVDSPFSQNVGGLEFSIGNLNDNRFFAGSSYLGVSDYSGVPIFRIIEEIKGYSDNNSGAFIVTVKKTK